MMKKPRAREPRLMLTLMEQHDILGDLRQLCQRWRQLRRKRRAAPDQEARAIWRELRRIAAAIAASSAPQPARQIGG